MLEVEALKNLLAKPDFTRIEKILLCLGSEPAGARAVKEVRGLAVQSGLRAAKKWNISQLLADSGGLAVRTGDGWELTEDGWNRVAGLAGDSMNRRARKVAAGLRHHLVQINAEDTRSFVEEAVSCLEQGLFRAAVVLSWVGAVSVLQEHVIREKLSVFNAEAARRDPRWKPAKTKDDLSLMKEFDFLQVLAAISVFGRNVKQELEVCLKLRNGCGHPNSLEVGEARTAAHVESLVLNVFSRF